MKPMKISEGDDTHIKGYIMNKLYLGRYFAKRGKKRHGKHTSVKNLPKGYPLEHRGKFLKAVNELRKAGLIIIFPSTKEKHVCAVLDSDLIDIGIHFVNSYRQSVGLPLLNDKLTEALKGK